MAALDDLREFSLEEAGVNLWVFKGPNGPSDEAPRFSGHWVDTTDQVDSVLKGILESARHSINEVIEYGLLAQNNEGSALVIATTETYADRLVERAAAETNEKRAVSVAHLRNSSFYDVKLVQEHNIIHAIRKTDRSWQGKRAIGLSTFLFRDEVLTLEERPKFDIDATIDFLVVGDQILILNKAHFESVLRYKATFMEDFAELKAEAAFRGAFVDVGPLVAFVGDNKLNLRRLSAIRQKGHYRDPQFMARLRELHHEFDLHLEFDAGGRIVVTPENCGEVITALLDHRLASAFSNAVYDVPSTTTVRTGQA
jgi:hypothetical protein